MELEKKEWNKFSYTRNQKSDKIGEITLKENKRIVEEFRFRNNNEFRLALSILQKHGFTPEPEKEKQIKLEAELERKNLEEVRNKQKGFLEKDWEW